MNFGVPSDHSAVKIVLKFKTPIHNKISYANNIDWNVFLDEGIKELFN